MNGHDDLIARHETILATQRRPRFILRATPTELNSIRLTRTRDEARWIADQIVQLEIFGPGLKNYDLIPTIAHGDYYYFFMGETDNPISYAKILNNGTFEYSAPAFTPIGFDVYPEMVFGYFLDFLGFSRALLRRFGYAAAFSVSIDLRNVGGVAARISNPSDWRPIAPNLITIPADVSVSESFIANQIDTNRLRWVLNRFISAVGISGHSQDTVLPGDWDARLNRFVSNPSA